MIKRGKIIPFKDFREQYLPLEPLRPHWSQIFIKNYVNTPFKIELLIHSIRTKSVFLLRSPNSIKYTNMKPLILNLLMLFPLMGWTQSPTFWQGFKPEIGIGYSTARWIVEDSQNGISDTTFRRNRLWTNPSFRLNYSFDLIRINDRINLSLRPFIGYFVFGGRSRVEPEGYEDLFRFRSAEVGLIPSLEIDDAFRLSLGLKGQYIFDVEAEFYGNLGQGAGTPREWRVRNVSRLYSQTAMNIGARFDYKIARFIIGIEGWAGITNLNMLQTAADELRVLENNVRLTAGFDL